MTFPRHAAKAIHPGNDRDCVVRHLFAQNRNTKSVIHYIRVSCRVAFWRMFGSIVTDYPNSCPFKYNKFACSHHIYPKTHRAANKQTASNKLRVYPFCGMCVVCPHRDLPGAISLQSLLPDCYSRNSYTLKKISGFPRSIMSTICKIWFKAFCCKRQGTVFIQFERRSIISES